MGIDLRLFPIDSFNQSTLFGFSHTVLSLPRDYEMFDAINQLEPYPLPVGHDISGFTAGTVPDGSCAGESCYGKFHEDPYGEPVTWVAAGPLARVLNQHLPKHRVTAFVSAMEPSTMVILGWC